MLYQSSKGAVEIDTMPFTYANNALNKLRREAPTRTAEIEALQAHIDKLEAAASNDDENPRAVIGGNQPPEAISGFDKIEARLAEQADSLTGRAAIETHVGDLLSEAGNWADGVPLVDQGQADAVGRLHRQLQQAVGLVDAEATKEKKPHNDAITEIATWQNAFTAKEGLKTIKPGSLTKAIKATGNLSAGWLRKLDDEKRAREKEAADAALAAAQEAAAAREEAKESTDLAVIDRAVDKLAVAMDLIGAAKNVSKEKVQAGGGDGFRAMSLRTVHKAVIEDAPDAWARAYGFFKQDPEFVAEFKGLIQKWADRACRNEATRVRGVPGFTMTEEKVV